MPIPSALAYENRDVAYALIAPVYDRLARFVPRWVTPNQLTLLGLGCAIAEALAMNMFQGAAVLPVAAALVLGYELFDSLDGKHARNTGQSSRFGAYLDTSIDGLAAGLLYTGLVGHFGLYSPLFLFAIVVRMAKACLVYASAAETGLRLNPEIGTTVENLAMVAVLLWSALWPTATLDLAGRLPALAGTLGALGIGTLDIVRAGLVFLVIFLPISSWFDVLEVKRILEAPAEPGAPAEG